jgi:hypothetical protein
MIFPEFVPKICQPMVVKNIVECYRTFKWVRGLLRGVGRALRK